MHTKGVKGLRSEELWFGHVKNRCIFNFSNNATTYRMIISLFVKYCQVVVLIVFWVPKNLASNIWYFSVTLNEGLEGGNSLYFYYMSTYFICSSYSFCFTHCFSTGFVSKNGFWWQPQKKSYNATVISRKYRPAGARIQQALQQLLEHVIVPVILALLYSKCTIFPPLPFGLSRPLMEELKVKVKKWHLSSSVM